MYHMFNHRIQRLTVQNSVTTTPPIECRIPHHSSSINSNLSPTYYRNASVESSVADSKASIEYIQSLNPTGTIVRPIVTPRFTPSCTSECLSAIGKLARDEDAYIQTHISKNVNKIALVHKLFLDAKSYADIYETLGLLGAKTILAHAVYLSAEERNTIKQSGSKISHYPASNTAITSGCCPVHTLLDKGHVIGLGTDVSGRFHPSILENVRHAI